MRVTAHLDRRVPRLEAQGERLDAHEAALARPYYAPHESDLARIQAEAIGRLHGWVTKTPGLAGDLLAAPVRSRPGEFDELAQLVRTWQSQQSQSSYQPQSSQQHRERSGTAV